MFLAGAALQGAISQDAPAADTAINAIYVEHGGEGLTEAIIAWCDTLTAALPLPPGEDLVGLGWIDETGQARTADDVDPQARWAGRIVMARAREDKDTFNALIGALPDDGVAASQHLAVLLHLIATNLRVAVSGQPPETEAR
jgi:cellulase/cellobiase CelA1